MLHKSLAKLGLAAVFAGSLAFGALAAPQQIIILRHGEKQDAYRLCQVGVERSLALAAQYLGKGAEQSLFTAEIPPAAFLAITLHTLELVGPAASSWNMPVTLYSVPPMTGRTAAETTALLNRRTQEAARDVMTNPAWDGKVVWEHNHIADRLWNSSLRARRSRSDSCSTSTWPHHCPTLGAAIISITSGS